MVWQLANSLVIALLMILCILFWFNNRKAKHDRQSLEQQHQQLKTEFEQFKQDAMATSVHSQQSVVNLKKQQQEVLVHLEQAITSISTIAQQSTDFASELEKTKDLVNILKSESSEQRLYGRAKKMIEMGADMQELMTECEVPRGEAELLMSLYKK